MKLSNVREKKERITKCDKYVYMWCWYFPMWQCNCQMWGKKIGYTECDKSTVKSDVDTAQCDNGTGKCEKKKIEYHRMW